ncbi:MAG: ATP-binding cassette domain-containing protein, partial [Lachnospiraceae bacterium]|nr:ATP-binding cassette domain-containing protein [Lachnospiraceae bacterium]
GTLEGTGEELPASHKIPGKADAPRDRQEALRIRHLTYSYEPGRPVLQEFELTVRPGEKIGILGHNGTGKSTLIRLLSKDLQPQSGRILYGDRDLQEISREDWPETAGVVSQECFLFDESLTYNMLLGRDPGPDRTARIRSLLDMDRDPAFDRADRGKVGDRGKDLSGGQRRKIELARVLLRDTPLILLDEPTAGLDRETKGLLIRILREKLRDKTVLCVTHDEDLLTCFDRTVRLAD